MKELDGGDERRDEVVEISESERLRLRTTAILVDESGGVVIAIFGRGEDSWRWEEMIIEAGDGMKFASGASKVGGWKPRDAIHSARSLAA
jgi:hypothetical protein